jgi:lysophospholipase L1-like esterase
MTTLHREHIEWCDIWVRSAGRTGNPRVLCIGDSICRGYYPQVEKLLDGKAEPARVASSRFACDPVLRQELALVLDQHRFAVIHVNNGLHGWDYSEADYEDGISGLIEFLRQRAPSASLVWASSTPLYQAGDPGRFDPRHGRVVERNRLAAAVMARHGIPINDLFTLALGNTAWFCNDGVHYTADGCARLADQVAARITARLA